MLEIAPLVVLTPDNGISPKSERPRLRYSCRICAGDPPHGVRPVLRIRPTAKLCIAGPAPAGQRVHNTGIAYADASGGRLRAWLAMDSDVFYDESRIAIVPGGFAFPGGDDTGADKPPRPECAHRWRGQLFAAAPKSSLLLAIATCAQRYYLNGVPRKASRKQCALGANMVHL